MKTKLLLIGVLILGAIVAGAVMLRQDQTAANKSKQAHVSHVSSAPQQAAEPARVPKYYESAASVGSLPKTLPPEQFFGKAREAYRVVREIPQTIAQLPCYCRCDVSFGHKSLHSCFEDGHASQCAVCVDEALLAYRLEKQEKLPASQIRELIIAQYSAKQ